MTLSKHSRSEATPAPSVRRAFWSGWVIFAALMLVLVGTVNVITGVVALLRQAYFAVGEGSLVVFDFFAWAVILLCFGGVMILAGIGLTSGRQWARVAAITLALVNVIAHLAFLAAYPAWSVITIAVDVLVVFALTARWYEVHNPLDVASVTGGNGQSPAEGESASPVAGSMT